MRITGAIMVAILLASACAIADTNTVTTGGPGPEPKLSAPIITGPSPLSEMSAYAGRSFDWQYMMSMYQQNEGIARIAALGSCRASCQALRDLSLRFVQEQMALNNGLEWASLEFTNAPKPNGCTSRRLRGLETVLMGYCGKEFDCQYVSVMLGLLQQSADAADRAILEVEDGQLLAQARATRRVNANESSQLKKFL